EAAEVDDLGRGSAGEVWLAELDARTDVQVGKLVPHAVDGIEIARGVERVDGDAAGVVEVVPLVGHEVLGCRAPRARDVEVLGEEQRGQADAHRAGARGAHAPDGARARTARVPGPLAVHVAVGAERHQRLSSMRASRACPYASAGSGSVKTRVVPSRSTSTSKPSSVRRRARKVERSRPRSWSSRGSHSASSMATESSAHSVVPLKPRMVPVGYSCASMVMVLTVKTSPDSPGERTWNWSPSDGDQTRPASCSRRASSEVIIGPLCRTGPRSPPGSHPVR